ncbi:DinB family protein [Rhizosphaericola mali]|uniref:DinB family protein n=1 Tax=Rhizosphaericola mali TaxID=2545455 RepID=A0A5P2G5C0_9BACT|nr:DinB family protein [Rhizosphaericola mali]QES89878.1 DinB family protein [Rhizosphaericola mali]
MLLHTLKQIFVRDLSKLKEEISLYNSESKIWEIDGNISNSGGNLCLHLIGNLNTYIGKDLGKIDYTRQRDLEFSLKNIPKKELLEKLDDTISRIERALDNFSENEVTQPFPYIVLGNETTIEYFLIHLATHLSYHLGQINYHRRLIDDATN